ncbi:SsrA-binding protein SmpB [bacterium]|jgi:SsrA-binding protein|nr:SsrA-binding protein SmpB [bacterium]
MSKKTSKYPGTYAFNSKAKHDFSILETVEAGIVLQGTEAKAIKSGGKVQFADAHVRDIGGEMYLINCYIAPYSHGTHQNHEPTRTRKLLLHRKEILRLSQKVREKGLTLVPLRFYAKKGLIKVEIGLGKGKKSFEKREDHKTRTVQRDLQRNFKQSQIKV